MKIETGNSLETLVTDKSNQLCSWMTWLTNAWLPKLYENLCARFTWSVIILFCKLVPQCKCSESVTCVANCCCCGGGGRRCGLDCRPNDLKHTQTLHDYIYYIQGAQLKSEPISEMSSLPLRMLSLRLDVSYGYIFHHCGERMRLCELCVWFLI